MSSQVEQKRRELFDEQMDKILCSEGFSDFSLASMMERGLNGHYYSSRIAGAWEGFNAALDAVVIELPGAHEAMKAVFDYQHGPNNKNVTGTTNWAANVGMVVVEDCRSAIQSTGLGLKVIP